MGLQPRDFLDIPEETRRVAQAAFPKGNNYMTMRDSLALWYKDSDYAQLFLSHQGQPALSPGRLNLIMIMQYAEGLSDQQTVEAVASRIDWKYALGLELTAPSFDASVLSDHRQRLLAQGAEVQLFDHALSNIASPKANKNGKS
jgi:transposase